MAVMHVDIERMQYDKTMTLDKLFKQMRLDDIDVKHKIWKLYSKKQDNVYFGNDFYNLAEKYDLKKIKNHPNNQKNFVRK